MIAMQRLALSALLVTGLVMGGIDGGVAHAKKKKAVVQVFVDGKKFKNSKRTPPSATYQTLTGLLTIVAGSQKGGARSVSIKSFSVGAVVDLSGPLPAASTSSTTMYTDNTYRGIVPPGPGTSWVGDGLVVTVDKYDGVRISGRIEGSVPPGSNASAPAVFTNGKFDLPVVVQ